MTAHRTRLRIPGLDCAAEERLVASALGGLPAVHHWQAELLAHELAVVHSGSAAPVLEALARVGLPGELIDSSVADSVPPAVRATAAGAAAERRTLLLLLAINAAMFVVEAVAGWLAESTGLLADSLDMFADAAVYSLSLAVVGAAAVRQRRVARLCGFVQLALAAGAVAEVVRRALVGSDPEPPAMMGVALLALAANASCVLLLARHRHGGAHLRASWIFSTTDALANVGVILAGLLVLLTASRWPDLVIGAAIAALVLRGALRILRLG